MTDMDLVVDSMVDTSMNVGAALIQEEVKVPTEKVRIGRKGAACICR